MGGGLFTVYAGFSAGGKTVSRREVASLFPGTSRADSARAGDRQAFGEDEGGGAGSSWAFFSRLLGRPSSPDCAEPMIHEFVEC